MKFKIELDEMLNKALVTNESENDFNTTVQGQNVLLASGSKLELPIPLAKIRFGDWTTDKYEEMQRRRNLGVAHFELEIITKNKKVETSPVPGFVEEDTEPEFPNLDTLNANDNHSQSEGAEEEQPEAPKEESPEITEPCQGTTKSGKSCKAKPLENGFCLAHQKQAKGE